jgi:hypothetical protein
MGMKWAVTHNRSTMQEASAQAHLVNFSPLPDGYFLLLCWGNRSKAPTRSYPHRIGGHAAVRRTRIVVVEVAVVVDIAKVGRGVSGF